MIDVLYKVVFEGDLLPGQDQAVVQKKLADLFGVDTKRAAQLFSGKQHKVKSNLDLKHAKKYALALAKLGALGYIEQEVVERKQSVELQEDNVFQVREDEKFTKTGSFDVNAVRAYFDEQENKRAENAESAESADHEIFNLDEFENEVAAMQEDDGELSGVQNVLNAEQIAKMLNSK
jgi:hypothetical protein